ncbi:uncharacterized protein si:dkey-205h13.2 [Cololabis saira]|uniref:uncharacterized protein si:dkey-205h13.2 n=1 Tax=Cololabis saira TaxID=129043 RepID=UPI002AD1E02F|nr:uncharacterized protein si:dkey-205h13.2 [Cololabis saira]
MEDGEYSIKPASGQVYWTKWYNRDSPGGTGDWEILNHLRKENPGEICENPQNIEVVATGTLTSALSTGEIFSLYSPTEGFVCRNKDQKGGGPCRDYTVRFACPIYWTKWYNRDSPGGTGDWEILNHLRKENPGEICENPQNIEVVATGTLTPALNTGEIFFLYSPTEGFVCRNKDQKCGGSCRDYTVRFACPSEDAAAQVEAEAAQVEDMEYDSESDKVSIADSQTSRGDLYTLEEKSKMPLSIDLSDLQVNLQIQLNQQMKKIAGQTGLTEMILMDLESGTLSELRNEHPGEICPKPSDIEYETLSGLTADEAGDV